MADPITKGDLLEMAGGFRDHLDARITEFRTEVRGEFREVTDHLGRLNSKVADHEATIRTEAQKTKSLEKEVFDRRAAVATGATMADEAIPVLTRGDLKRLAWVIGTLLAGSVGAMEFLHRLLGGT